ncbi:hypothetical protein M9H77_36140 [Catharanthus roseus]|uniref:Uncharacterized protein n=1 Tax=Catharanthus roseus TaxID=4058 RepID=A0ACB9ZRB5_CATRO|nr:hypothetical protein M9H77_36140 [Catharanthus roseus]
MLKLQDLRRSSCTRLSNSGRVMCRLAIYYDFSENKTLAAQLENYNVVAKIKMNQMQGKNTVEEVLCLSAQRGYTVFHRNREESNKVEGVVKTRWKSRPDFLHYLFSTWLNPFAHKFCRVRTSQVFHFEVETTNRAESEHSVLKLWLSTCHGQIAKIKYTLKISKLKEKYSAKSNAILKKLSNKVSHLALKKIMDELKKAREMVEELGSNCLHYLRKSHGLPCACELEDVDIFWRKLEIGSDIPEEHDRDMDSEMHDLTSLIHKISMSPISKSRGSSSGSGNGSGSGSGSCPIPRGRSRPPRSGRGRGRGRNSGRSSVSSVVNPDAPSMPFPFNNAFPGFIYEFILNWKNVSGDGNCGFRIVSNFLFRDENHWVEIRRRMCFDLHHRMNVYVQLFGSIERVTELKRRTNWEEGSASANCWMDTPDLLYVIANTFNLCVVFLARLGSTTVLPLVSNIDGNAGKIFIGFIEEQ